MSVAGSRRRYLTAHNRKVLALGQKCHFVRPMPSFPCTCPHETSLGPLMSAMQSTIVAPCRSSPGERLSPPSGPVQASLCFALQLAPAADARRAHTKIAAQFCASQKYATPRPLLVLAIPRARGTFRTVRSRRIFNRLKRHPLFHAYRFRRGSVGMRLRAFSD